jgi:hypothetical protein
MTFAILRFGPVPPAIIAAPSFEDVKHGFGGSIHHDPSALKVMHTVGAVQSSVWLVSHLSQVSSPPSRSPRLDTHLCSYF